MERTSGSSTGKGAGLDERVAVVIKGVGRNGGEPDEKGIHGDLCAKDDVWGRLICDAAEENRGRLEEQNEGEGDRKEVGRSTQTGSAGDKRSDEIHIQRGTECPCKLIANDNVCGQNQG